MGCHQTITSPGPSNSRQFAESIREKHKAAGWPQPDDFGPEVLYFFHERQSGRLFPVKQKLAVKLVGELVYHRGGHVEMSDQAIQIAADSVRAAWLFWYMQRSNLVQFHPDLREVTLSQTVGVACFGRGVCVPV